MSACIKDPIMKTTARLYRGQYGEHSDTPTTRLGSLSLGDLETAHIYAHSPNQRGDRIIEPCILQVDIEYQHPFVNTPGDAFIDYIDLEARLGTESALTYGGLDDTCLVRCEAWNEMCALTGTLWPTLSDVYKVAPHLLTEVSFQLYRLLDDHAFVQLLRQRGYDTAIYRSSGVSLHTHEVRVIDITCIRKVKRVL